MSFTKIAQTKICSQIIKKNYNKFSVFETENEKLLIFDRSLFLFLTLLATVLAISAQFHAIDFVWLCCEMTVSCWPLFRWQETENLSPTKNGKKFNKMSTMVKSMDWMAAWKWTIFGRTIYNIHWQNCFFSHFCCLSFLFHCKQPNAECHDDDYYYLRK